MKFPEQLYQKIQLLQINLLLFTCKQKYDISRTIVLEDTIAPVRPTIACKQAKLGLDSLHSASLHFGRDDILRALLLKVI